MTELSSATPANVPTTIAIFVTRRCNMSCSHCSVESGPRVDTPDPAEDELLRVVRESAAAGVRAVQFTGGEPMMRQKLVLRLMKEAQRRGMVNGLTTNGFWGKNAATARATLKRMLRLDLHYLTVSYDRYHAEFIGPEPILNIASAAQKLGFAFNLNVTRTLHDENLDEYARLFGELPNVRMRLYDVQPVGRARKFDLPELRAETEGFCNAAAQATFTEDGRVIACNGPAYFDNAESPRHVGSYRDDEVTSLLKRHSADPILDTIRTFGPAGLRDELKKDAQFAGAFDRRFAGQCDLCHFICGNDKMVAHLRETLTNSAHGALRTAKAAMIAAARESGELTREHANGPGIGRIFYEHITTGAWPAGCEHLLGRADIDWDHQANYLAGCGLANVMVRAAVQPQLARWAPPYFAETLQKRATRDALRELSHRETLDRIHESLGELGVGGVLLKGAALYVREQSAGLTPLRVPGDIDIWVENAGAADALRRKLIKSGFGGKLDAPRTGPHHLAPIKWRNSTVEIHTGVMPAFWGLPEAEMSGRSVPVPGRSNFATLAPNDMALHELVHSTSHLYSFGIKLALDIFRINRLSAPGGTGFAAAEAVGSDEDTRLNWHQAAGSAEASRCPNAFRVPLRALLRGLPSLPIDPDAMSGTPQPKRVRHLVLVAYKRLFTAMDNAENMNPFTRNGIFLLLHDGVISRGRYLAELGRGDAAESRRVAMAGDGGQSWKNIPGHLRAAWHDLQAYRRATARR